MFKKFKSRVLGSGEGQKRRESSSASINLGSPRHRLTLIHMAVALNIMGVDLLGDATILLLHFLEEGQNPNLVASYSFDKFIAGFDDMLWQLNPTEPSEIRYGKLGYFTARQDYERVYDQNSFEVALNHMFINRGDDEILSFHYQPEFKAQREERLAAGDRTVADDSGLLNQSPRAEAVDLTLSSLVGRVLLVGGTTGRSSSLPVAGYSNEHSYKATKYHDTIDNDAGAKADKDVETARLEDLEKNDTIASSPVSPLTTRTARPSSFPVKASDEDHALVRIPTNSSSGRKSRAGSIKNAAKKLIGIAVKKEPESREETLRRFQTMYDVVGETSYTRGGDEEALSPEDVLKFQKADRTVIEGEAEFEPERKEEEEEDDSEISVEDRIVAKLQQLQNMEELGQLRGPSDTVGTLNRWTECCAMFRIDPSETKMGEVVRIAGLKTPLYQYQAFGVYWQMITSREFGGGFVADDMGLGKTLSFLAYVVVERQLAVLWRDVLKCRVARDRKHLQAGESGACPTPPKKGWISCPCSSSSPTSRMTRKAGLRMACVPQALVGQWWAQWKMHVDTSDASLGMKIVVDHPALVNDLKTPMEDRKDSCEQAQTRGRMEATKAVKNSKQNDTPKDYQEGILFLTTKENYPKSMKQYFESPGFVHDPKAEGAWKAGTRCSLIFGIAMIDESHEEYFKNKGRAAILTNLPRQNNTVQPFLWGYSGTPFSQTPRGIEGVLWAIQKHSKAGLAAALEWKKLDEICKSYDNQLKSHRRDDAAVDRILGEFKPFLVKLMLRRTAETKWFGHSIMKLPPHTHTDIHLGPNKHFTALIPAFEATFDHEREELLEALQRRWEDFPEQRRSNIKPTKLAFNTETRTLWRSRILATFPYLFQLMRATEDRLTLTAAEVQRFQARKDMNPYRKYLRPIVEGSPKCLWLYRFITDLSQQVDVNGNPHKLVIMTSFPQVAYILQLFIIKYFPAYRDLTGLISGRMKPSEKNALIHAFTSPPSPSSSSSSSSSATSPPSKSSSKAPQKEVRILIGLTHIVGVGLQLQRACHAVLMEPDYDFVRELQAYARVHRIGQKNPRSRSFRLVDCESEVESAILARQRARGELAGREVREVVQAAAVEV